MNDKTHVTTPANTKTQLRAPSFWQIFVVPPILLLVGLNTLFKDRFFASFLTRRTYATFTFSPRKQNATKTDAIQKVS